MDRIGQRDFELGALTKAFPPNWLHPHKKRIHEICRMVREPDDPLMPVSVSRWTGELPSTGKLEASDMEISACAEFFEYEESISRDRSVWYLNFAHSNLFCAYGGPLLAQDELQCLEHPVLGSIAEALRADAHFHPVTVHEGRPTPILVKGALRVCKLDTSPSGEEPLGLYGNAFAASGWANISDKLEFLEPASVTNIVAMEALTGAIGGYTKEQIRYLLETAFIGFSAAVRESHLPTEVHTGFWGCGAYGGNRLMMSVLQIVAATLAQIDQLIIHTGSRDALNIISEAIDLVDSFEMQRSEVDQLISIIAALNLEWGISDGN